MLKMCKELKVKNLPKDTPIRGLNVEIGRLSRQDIDIVPAILNDFDYVMNDVGENMQRYVKASGVSFVHIKLRMMRYVQEFLNCNGFVFDEFNGLPPTRVNKYKAYEFAALWMWTEIVHAIKTTREIKNSFYKKYRGVLSSTMKKYPKITGILISCADLKIPGNKLMEYSRMENADFENDHTDEVIDSEKANEFKEWILEWSSAAVAKDKMRVKNWFETKKSHKQIFAEINKVVGNTNKFNARLALFVERLFNQEGLDYFFEKTGFDSKEDLFMAYFDKLTEFDEETKKSFIKKYLLGSDNK